MHQQRRGRVARQDIQALLNSLERKWVRRDVFI